MKKLKSKKILSMVMVFMMMISVMPMQVFAEADVNLLRNAGLAVTATASSTVNQVDTPEKIMDGEKPSTWEELSTGVGVWKSRNHTSDDLAANPEWVTVDFGREVTVNRMVMYKPQYYNQTYDGTYGRSSARAFTLQGSNNGTDYTVLKSFEEDYNSTKVDYTLATPVSYRYFKIHITSISSFDFEAEGAQAVISELELYGPAPVITGPTLAAGAVDRTSNTAATVKFTSDTAGTYYYGIVPTGDSAPDIDTTGTGTACTTDETSINASLTEGAKDLYIKVKDSSGNVSDALKIQIPAYSTPVVNSWSVVGTAGFSAGSTDYTTIVTDSTGVPYVAYLDWANSGKATVMKLDGTSWIPVGSPGFTQGRVDFISLTLDKDNIPYVVYRDEANGKKATVMKFNGTSWVLVGSAGFSAGWVEFCTIVTDRNGVPYVAYKDVENGNKATVMKFNGTSWVAVGNVGFSVGQALTTSMDIDSNNTLYVAIRDQASSGKATVLKFNGTNWVTVGNAGFSQGIAGGLKIAIDNTDTPYVVYGDNVAPNYLNKATVMKFTGGSWETVGSPSFSEDGAYDTAIDLDEKGRPYVVYADTREVAGNPFPTDTRKATVMSFNGTNWESVGNAEFSDGDTEDTSIVVNGQGKLYVIYSDQAKSGKATVMTHAYTTDTPSQSTVPTAAPTNLNLSTLTDGQTSISYTAATSAEKYLIVRDSGQAPTFAPQDGVEYTAGAVTGGTVVYAGIQTTYTDTNTPAGTQYFYKIYSYNGSDANTLYYTTEALEGNVIVKSGDTNAAVTFDSSNKSVASFPDAGVKVEFPSGTDTTLTVSKKTSAPTSNFYGNLPGGRSPKALYFKVESTPNASAGTYNIVLDFSSIVGNQTAAENFKLMKRADSSSPWVDISNAITNRQTDGVWGKFTVSGLTSFSEFAGCETAAIHNVTNSADSGAGTLRAVLNSAQSGDVINFDTTAMGGNEITLNSPLALSKDVTIIGANGGVILNGNRASKLVEIDSNATVRLENLKLQNGKDTANIVGGIYNKGTLYLVNSVVSGNSATGTWTDGQYGYGGVGGILQDDASAKLYIVNSTLADNTGANSDDGTGAICADGLVEIYNTIVYGNQGQHKNTYFYSGTGDIKAYNSLFENADAYYSNTSYSDHDAFNSATDVMFNQDPKFVGVGSNKYHIFGNSPCVDIGNNDYILSNNDLRGINFARKLDKSNAAVGRVDLGAYEYKHGVDYYRSLDNDVTAPILTTGIASRNSDTKATVKFTSNEAGQYYYAIVADGAAVPTIDSSGAGTSCTTSETIITDPTGLTAGARDIYVVVKDAAGNVSSALKIDIAAYAVPSNGSGGGSSSTVSIQPSQGTIAVIVNGQIHNATATGNVIQVPIADTKSAVAKVELTGDIVKKLETNNFDVSVKRDNIEYIIPAEEFTIRKVAENLGVTEKDLGNVKVEIQITKLDQQVVEKYNEVAKANGAELVFPPVAFEVVAKTTKADGTTGEVEINKFSNYVERVMEIPAGVDPSKITTGIVFNPDGTYSHVPTDVFQKDGKWYARLNSLTNSNYAVVWNPVTVKSVEKHWSKDAVNDMASRLIIFNPEKFEPNKAITRADFAEYIVRALGLYREGSKHENKFSDVSTTGDRTLAILIASEYGIVSGYPDGTFRSDALITREEAMTMYQRAMKITKLVGTDNNRYQSYTDYKQVGSWATPYVQAVLSAHVFNGTTATTISPKANLTYAEAAQAIKNLLVESKLINK